MDGRKSRRPGRPGCGEDFKKERSAPLMWNCACTNSPHPPQPQPTPTPRAPSDFAASRVLRGEIRRRRTKRGAATSENLERTRGPLVYPAAAQSG